MPCQGISNEYSIYHLYSEQAWENCRRDEMLQNLSSHQGLLRETEHLYEK